MRPAARRLLGPLLMLALLAAGVWAFLPQPVPVEAAHLLRGPLRVTVDAEGRTAVRETYLVSMPLAGRLQRPTLHAGDTVEAGATVLATVEPTEPGLLDARAEAVAQARVRTAEAAEAAAAASVDRARVALVFEEKEVERRAPLARAGGVPATELAERMQRLYLAQADLRSAELGAKVAVFEREQAEAALLYTVPPKAGEERPTRYQVRSPISGVVLRVLAQDEGVLAAGTRLVEVGDLTDLEVEADVLTRDAVRVLPGQAVVLEQWGGGVALEGRVRRVEPAAFTKVSALGVEEQRVWVKIDLLTPPAARVRLGQGFRVEARIVVEELAEALLVPTGALFRDGDGWAAFVVKGGRAERTAVATGLSDGRRTQVLSGLAPDDVVVAYPSDRVADGVRVAARSP